MIDFDVKSYMKLILPPGGYTLQVINADLKPTKKNDGSQYLEVTFKVISQFMTGHSISKKFNLYNSSETAQRIAREHFATFCNMVGLSEIKAYSELDNCIVKAIISEGSYNGEPTNEIDKFIKCEDEEVRDFQAPDKKLDDDIPF